MVNDLLYELRNKLFGTEIEQIVVYASDIDLTEQTLQITGNRVYIGYIV